MSIREIIHRYFNNKYSRHTQREFTVWFKEPSDHIEKESAIKEVWDHIDVQADKTTEQSFHNLMSIIDTSTVGVKKQKTSIRHRFERIAAIFLLPLLATGITYYIMQSSIDDLNNIQMMECIVPKGEVYTITLSDSSVINVNAGSILIYPEKFTNRREIFLNGEAYFNVSKDERKPFIVKTTDMNIEVLGTTFNISSYADDEKSTTTLESGKVDISFKNIDELPITLHPSEQITFNRVSRLIQVDTVSVEKTISWIDGSLAIQSMSINEIARIIERKYNIIVHINTHYFKDELITMKVGENESIEEFMNILKQLIPQMEYTFKDDKLYINHKNI